MTDKLRKEAKEKFWDMFICDAILGNRDRHWGNWGYLRKKGKDTGYKSAPIFDNGSSLYPGVNNVISQYIDELRRKKFIYDRVFVFPASLLKIRRKDRAYRTNYAEMFSDLRINKIFAERVDLLRSRLTYDEVFAIMVKLCQDIPLSVEYRRYYIEIVTMRFMCILMRMDFDTAFGIIERRLMGYG